MKQFLPNLFKCFTKSTPLGPKNTVIQQMETRNRDRTLPCWCGLWGEQPQVWFSLSPVHCSDLWILLSVGYPRNTDFVYSFRNPPDLTDFLICQKHGGYREKRLNLSFLWRRQGYRCTDVQYTDAPSKVLWIQVLRKEMTQVGPASHWGLLEITLDKDLAKQYQQSLKEQLREHSRQR